MIAHDIAYQFLSLADARHEFGEAQLQMGWNYDETTDDTLLIRPHSEKSAGPDAIQVYVWHDRKLSEVQGFVNDEIKRLGLIRDELDKAYHSKVTTLYAGEPKN